LADFPIEMRLISPYCTSDLFWLSDSGLVQSLEPIELRPKPFQPDGDVVLIKPVQVLRRAGPAPAGKLVLVVEVQKRRSR
jgi:hypothetical protein